MFETLAATAVGLHTPYTIRDANVVLSAIPAGLLPDGFGPTSTALPMTFLDSTASTKMLGPVHQSLQTALVHYANSHSTTYGSARLSTHAYEEAHETVMRFVDADPATHAAVFVGSGATGAINRVARTLFWRKSDDSRDTVVFSGMEHHANQLPWNKYAPRSLGVAVDPVRGTLNLDHFESVLRKNAGRTRLVAVTGVSNVTGIVNDVKELARMAHETGAEILIDGAQMAAHKRISMRETGADYLVFSGHKVYAPGSPGVLVLPKETSSRDPDEMGGGIVLSVNFDYYLLSDQMPAREEAGTPNILGAVTLARALKILQDIGMDKVWEHELALTSQLLGGLSVFDEVKVYGDTDLSRTPRAGVVSFSVADLPHAVVAQALADYFNIAVRNECFCAHPYVKALKGVSREELEAFERAIMAGDRSNVPGMVRASLGVYTQGSDIERFHAAIDWIVANRERLASEYAIQRDGSAVRRDDWKLEAASFGGL